MIKTLADRATAVVFVGKRARSLPADIQARARMKLRILDQTNSLDDLRSPPGNHLEALRGDRVGQHSIRINGQWRICFEWSDGDAFDMQIVDYHS